MNEIEILTMAGIITTSIVLGMIIGMQLAWKDAKKVYDRYYITETEALRKYG
tara:strand:- start:275 stop:430 length:156 start_codon:yes stop_codon:yes gene_type:complete